jgi:hypothetical protein
MRKFIIVAASVASCLHSGVAGQSFHLRPATTPPIPETERGSGTLAVMLTMKRGTDQQRALKDGTTMIRVFGERLFVWPNGDEVQEFDLANRTMQDVVTQLNDKFGPGTASTEFPEYPARYIQGLRRTPLSVPPFQLSGGLGGPTIDLGLGAVFPLAEVATDRKSLLSNGGLLLDLVGTQAISLRDYLRLRLSFSTSDAQIVGNDEGEEGEAASDPLTAAVVNTERFSVGIAYDHQVLRATRYEVGLSLDTELAWTALEPFTFPTVTIGEADRSVADLYSATRIAEARETLDRVLPLTTALIGWTLRFPSVTALSIYFTGHVGYTGIVSRSVDFAAVERPAAETLVPHNDVSRRGIWRIGTGLAVGSDVEIRADAYAPLRAQDLDIEPLLRLMLTKQFSLK